MYSLEMLDLNSVILVNRENDNFVITDLATGKKVIKNSSEFYGNLYKYNYDFLRTFGATFSKDAASIKMSFEAANLMTRIVAFNQIDN